MSDPFRTTPGMIPPGEARVLSPRVLLLVFLMGTVLIAAAATWFVYFSKPDLEARERAIRQALGLAQIEEYVPTYPVTGTPIALDPRCDRVCADREIPEGRTLAQTGPRPQGFLIVDSPPPGCALLSMRFSEAAANDLTSEAFPAYLDAAPIDQLQRCNPAVPIRREANLVQVPVWYRSNFGVAVSVPGVVIASAQTFRVAVCARKNDGTLAQYAGDENMGDLTEETVIHCQEP